MVKNLRLILVEPLIFVLLVSPPTSTEQIEGKWFKSTGPKLALCEPRFRCPGLQSRY